MQSPRQLPKIVITQRSRSQEAQPADDSFLSARKDSSFPDLSEVPEQSQFERHAERGPLKRQMDQSPEPPRQKSLRELKRFSTKSIKSVNRHADAAEPSPRFEDVDNQAGLIEIIQSTVQREEHQDPEVLNLLQQQLDLIETQNPVVPSLNRLSIVNSNFVLNEDTYCVLPKRPNLAALKQTSRFSIANSHAVVINKDGNYCALPKRPKLSVPKPQQQAKLFMRLSKALNEDQLMLIQDRFEDNLQQQKILSDRKIKIKSLHLLAGKGRGSIFARSSCSFTTKLQQDVEKLKKFYAVYNVERDFDEELANKFIESGLFIKKADLNSEMLEGDLLPEEWILRCRLLARPFDARCPIFENGR